MDSSTAAAAVSSILPGAGSSVGVTVAGSPTAEEDSSSSRKNSRSSSGGGSKQQQKKKFVGVRQRPSGRWVAEIKDSTQKLRLWLGTFDNAEDAARAYDDAARALRGANTRTNFKLPGNASGRFSKATRMLLQRVAMRSSGSEALKENQALIASDNNNPGAVAVAGAFPHGLYHAAGGSSSDSSPMQSFSSQQVPGKDKLAAVDPGKSIAPRALQQHQFYGTSPFGGGFQSPALATQQQIHSKSVYGAFIEKLGKVPRPPPPPPAKHDLPYVNGYHGPLMSENERAPQETTMMMEFQDDQGGSGGEDYIFKSYSATSSRFMSPSIRVPPSDRYKVAPSIHVYNTAAQAAAAAAADLSDSDALIQAPNIRGSESPIILNKDDPMVSAVPAAAMAISSCDSVSPGPSTPSGEEEESSSFWSYFDQALCAVT
ncbi:hypothetical protein SELMODRAFT_409196 [Selaginella moellendorffii]|uniref:AP2/ERF domain-containing protein n=1 Tax=Selaginella moellendorffii TaxID=88036 RepID=D8RAN8_SELML|nr:ethylene-responsive transcription factor ESR1 [Selaginella moellendorffii]EFJ30350.1 hypothetical protein SELMODRAFT_409196 [Selaginella moellendorffii]|eukprot:XP_002968096.1 ethylene-responsive transcription factor ESR1 [Selaginella moellendorffii]